MLRTELPGIARLYVSRLSHLKDIDRRSLSVLFDEKTDGQSGRPESFCAARKGGDFRTTLTVTLEFARGTVFPHFFRLFRVHRGVCKFFCRIENAVFRFLNLCCCMIYVFHFILFDFILFIQFSGDGSGDPIDLDGPVRFFDLFISPFCFCLRSSESN